MDTKHRLEQWLPARGYPVAPVTLDNSDYIFASVYAASLQHGDREKADGILAEYIRYMQSMVDFFDRRSIEVLGRRLRQTLLIHASELNRDSMPALLDMFRKSGYAFISLEEALKDPAYKEADDYAGPRTFPGYIDGRSPKGRR